MSADAPPSRDVRGAVKWLFPYFDDAQVLAFRDTYANLGVSFDQLMDAEAAGHLGAYEATINVGRVPPLNMRHAIMAYQAIMARLHDDGRCLDFVRQTTADEAGSCAVEKWRRCCRGTANDADQVLLCAKHEHLLHPPAMATVTHAANSYRVEPLPLRTTVLAGLAAASRRATTPADVASAGVASSRWQRQRQSVGRRATAGCNDTTTPDTPRSAASAALAASIATLVAGSAPSAAAVDHTEAAAAARVVEATTVVPVFFEDQYVERQVAVDDAWVAWCKEFLFFSAGCVEYCCTTQLAGSAVCDTSTNPDGCL